MKEMSLDLYNFNGLIKNKDIQNIYNNIDKNFQKNQETFCPLDNQYKKRIEKFSPIERINHFIQKNEFVAFCKVDDKYIGYATFIPYYNQGKMFLTSLYIEEEYRSSGYGKKLMQEIHSLSFTKFKLRKMRLLVFDKNLTAITFYQKFGYKEIEKKHIENNNYLIEMENNNIEHFY